MLEQLQPGGACPAPAAHPHLSQQLWFPGPAAGLWLCPAAEPCPGHSPAPVPPSPAQPSRFLCSCPGRDRRGQQLPATAPGLGVGGGTFKGGRLNFEALQPSQMLALGSVLLSSLSPAAGASHHG